MGYPGVDAGSAQEFPVKWTAVLFIDDPLNGAFNTLDYSASNIV
jgi:hypothetical protein